MAEGTEIAAHTPGPWPEPEYDNHGNGGFAEWWEIGGIARVYQPDDARLIAAAPLLLEAAQLLEAAELGRQDCDECEDQGEPEACGKCFPQFDDARVKRRFAIAKATGTTP